MGPRAWSFWVEIPISDPRPSSPPSTNRLDAFTTTAADNTKLYRAVFTNANGTAQTTAALLTVDSPIAVTTNPVSQTVCSGTTATFTAAANGNSTVQWQVSPDGITFTNISGANSATYSFTTASTDNNKRFRAVFTNSCGSVNTSAATLTVNSAPVVTTNPSNQTACAGATATFTAADGVGSTVQWQVSIDGGVTFTNIAGATSTTYSFTTIDFPGDPFTQLLGINDDSLIAGYHGSGAAGSPNKGFRLTLPETFTL